MKHIFYIHSGLTFLVTLGVVEKLRLIEDDVAFIFGRSFFIANKYAAFKLNNQQTRIADVPSYGNKEVIKNYSTLKKIDQEIKKISNNKPFTIYLPIERNYLMQFLQTQKLCVRRNFIEEGLLTYHGSFLKHGAMSTIGNWISYYLRFPFHLNRSLVNRPSYRYDPDNFQLFGCTQSALLISPKWRIENVDVSHAGKLFQNTSLSTNFLFIFDPVVEKKIVEFEEFRICVLPFLKEHFNETTIVNLKFHPQQVDCNRYLQLFEESKIPYLVLHADVIPEVLLLKNANMQIFGLCSSVLFYAREWNHSVKSFSPSLARTSDTYRTWVLKSIPKNIIGSLKLIE